MIIIYYITPCPTTKRRKNSKGRKKKSNFPYWVRVCCFSALVTLLVNDATTREQRNTTVAVLGKGSSFGVCTLMSRSCKTLIWRVYLMRTSKDLWDMTCELKKLSCPWPEMPYISAIFRTTLRNSWAFLDIWKATILPKSPWDTRKKHGQYWTFVKNALRKSGALFISHCFGHCPPPSHPKQCWKRLQWFWVWRALQINIAVGVEGGCANLRCFCESVPRLLARIVEKELPSFPGVTIQAFLGITGDFWKFGNWQELARTFPDWNNIRGKFWLLFHGWLSVFIIALF